jgi:hypothetical protein
VVVIGIKPMTGLPTFVGNDMTDSHLKLILTLDDDPEGNYDGIISKNVFKNVLLWLLED